MRLKDKIAIVVGAGQTPGDTIGNGRATALLFAREGASVLLVDRDEGSAAETMAMIANEGGIASTLRADITSENDCAAIAATCIEHYGRIDILQNNVGIGLGDGGVSSLEADNWDTIMAVNLKGMWMTCKYVIPHMRKARAGAIVNISSGAAVMAVAAIAYKVSKAGVNALTHAIAWGNGKYGIRANTIMPGLLDTPMAIESHHIGTGKDRDQLRAERNAAVPLANRMGTAWDTAYASLFLASDEARFITGVVLPVDGGQAARIGF
ncbi:SDR family NAD(P)-dependent oxidoreductase [Novosphingobium sp. Gsoil 351]|uniref:SDR family NAD(P)-dependent oxidoreductase n=1 Tax=Novosphingobium sp. Gsoil 351 TaxID=2675225 RepID=UPI0012B4AE4A|nr:SDR family NAD(P)-dependent oxidoreductase [Novosphingobium sp. Gsoil 351]QGN53467.1 SDR family oxidoreductase [Novosphingobium sp. Gsoil 351]